MADSQPRKLAVVNQDGESSCNVVPFVLIRMQKSTIQKYK